MSRITALGIGALAAYIGTIFAANWAIEEWGVVPVGFGLMAPAGVYFAGLAFTFRDCVDWTLGRVAVICAILVGAGLSALVSTDLALASAVAFLCSELADYAVYQPLRRRGWMKAVVASNIVGIVLDSVLFLWIAFGSLEFLTGQILGKAWMTLAAIIVIGGVRAVLSRNARNQLAVRTDVPLFVSRRRLTGRKMLPVALGPWCLDSGGFTELNLYGRWATSEAEYVSDVRRFHDEIGNLAWVAPQDWMCEPFVLDKTGLSVQEHQWHTVRSFERLRDQFGELVIPVVQGWTEEDYFRCWQLYDNLGISLEAEPLVGLGSVCRRQDTASAAEIARSLTPLRLHGFGVKISGLALYGDRLTSADSMAWSYSARRDRPLPGCTHKSCANCLRYALRWRDKVLRNGVQLELAP